MSAPEDDTCEGCGAPAIYVDSEGVRLCAECAEFPEAIPRRALRPADDLGKYRGSLNLYRVARMTEAALRRR